MKTTLALIGLAGALVFTSPALAQGNSEPGIDRYNEISSNPNPDAQCGTGGGSGAFGYLGKDINLGINGTYNNDGIPGTDGYQTGLNNSGVCGSDNRPNNPPN